MKKVLLFIVTVAVIGLGVYAIVRHNPKTEIKNENTNLSENNDNGTVAGETTINTSNAKDIGAIFFYSSTCPHCKTVEEYFKDNKVEEKIKVDQRETHDKTNSALYEEKQALCKDFPAENKGSVPFLYTPDKCFIGSDQIIDFFNAEIDNFLKQQAGIN